MTDAEQLLWSRVRRKQIQGIPFYRQKPLGPYIVDFFASAARLVVEVDGSQHFTEAGCVVDAERDRYLATLGLRVLRFDNLQVLKQTEAVMEVIWRAVLTGLNPPQPPFVKGGRDMVSGSDGDESIHRPAFPQGGS